MLEHSLEFVYFSAWWGGRLVLDSVRAGLPRRGVCAVIGPSGAGKSTLLRAINRLNEGLPGWRTAGEVRLDGAGSYRNLPLVELRRRVGMVFQKPVVFPRSIGENAIFGLRYTGRGDARRYGEASEKALRAAHLWEEVRDRLEESALALSLGQQQRLCLARALAVEPEILLLDEPTASLDPRAQAAVEETLLELKSRLSILIVTHDLAQTRRLADTVLCLYPENGTGRLAAFGAAEEVLSRPQDPGFAEYLGAHHGVRSEASAVDGRRNGGGAAEGEALRHVHPK